MSDAGQLLVNTGGDLTELGILPVRVRTDKGRLVASGVTGRHIAVPPGSYEVTVVKPDLVECGTTALVEIAADKPASIILGMTAPAEPESYAIYSQAEAIAPQIEAGAGEPFGPESKTVEAQIWRGRWMNRWASVESAFQKGLQKKPVLLSETAPITLTSNHKDDRFLVTPYERDGAIILRFSIVPHDECVPCVGDAPEEKLISASLQPGFIYPTLRYRSLRSQEANSLLEFVDSGAFNDLQSVTSPMIERGVEGMKDAQFSLLRGTLGAYVMLRANNVEKLEPWLAEMGDQVPGLSDIPIMRAELLGRLGRHGEAEEIKIALKALCPWFRSGVGYLLDRLRLYLSVDAEDKATLPMTQLDWEDFSFAKVRLEKLSPFLVAQNLFTTFDIPK
jgi:hypothetical protein